MNGEIVEIAKILLALIPYSVLLFQKLKDIFKTHEVAFINQEDVDTLEKLSEAVKKIRSDENLQELPDLKKLLDDGEDFFKNHIVGYDNDQPIVIPKKYSVDNLVKQLRISKKESLLGKITLIPRREFKEFKQKPKFASKNEVEVIASMLEPERSKYTSLLALSIHIEELYNEGRVNLAEKTRQAVKERYGNFGLKFCNLYQRGYLKKLFNLVGDKGAETIRNEIKRFFHDAKCIFFVHKSMEVSDLEENRNLIQIAFDNKKDYIALHSLGTAVELSKNIVKDLTGPPEYHYEFFEGKDWKGLGEKAKT